MKMIFRQTDTQAHLKTLFAGCSLLALALRFVVWGIFFWQQKLYPASFFLLALAVGCRPFTALLAAGLYLPVFIGVLREKRFVHAAAFTLPPALVAAAPVSFLTCTARHICWGIERKCPKYA